MKRLFLALIFPTPFACNAFAQNASQDVLYLKDGSYILGTIVEIVPAGSVKIKLLDGSVLAFPMSRVERIGRAASRSIVANPYTTHRKISAWGLASSMAITMVGSLAMEDAYFATTVLPVVGPFITVVRIENTPGVYYRPGGKPLLIASGIMQTAFLVYFVAAWPESVHMVRELPSCPQLGASQWLTASNLPFFLIRPGMPENA